MRWNCEHVTCRKDMRNPKKNCGNQVFLTIAASRKSPKTACNLSLSDPASKQLNYLFNFSA